jgi:hypothetical protein
MCMILPPRKNTLIAPSQALLTQGFLLSEHFSLTTPVDADYVVWRTIFDINKVLVNLQ